MTAQNRVRRIQAYGQSIWLDYIGRDLFQGKLQQLIDEDGLRGITSNPAIFEKAIADSSAYDADLRAADRARSVEEIYWNLAVADIQQAADIFRAVYDETEGGDGYVSLEVSPHLARDTQGTIEDARRLWQMVARPNVMIKVPATEEGIPAIRQLIGDGVNVNVTLIFGLPRYRRVLEAYIAGLEERLARGESVDNIASVASFFLSRIDVLVDKKLKAIMADGGDRGETAKALYGEVAIANAKVAYQIFQEVMAGERWQRLAEAGARPQRLLWASTSTKDPEFSDVRYVEALIGPETVNTVPMETLDAFRDHGDPALRLTQNVEQAQALLDQLSTVGIDLDQVTEQLEEEGIEKFIAPFDSLLETLAARLKEEKAVVSGR